MCLAHKHTSVSTSKPSELGRKASARPESVKAVCNESKLSETKSDGGRKRRAHGCGQSSFALDLGETTTSKAKQMTHGRSWESEIDVSLIDGTQVGLEG